MRVFSRIFFSLLLLIGSFVFVQSVHAQTVTPSSINAQYLTPDTNPDVPKNLHTFSQSIILDVTSFFICQLAGYDPTAPDGKCLGFDPQTKKIGYVANPNGGVVGFLQNNIASLYISPIHSNDFFQYLSANFQNPGGKKVFAADKGVGEVGIQPLLKLWVVSRNISYALLVLVFILTGLFIMLRLKIDPRTVMSIQNQLPKLIIGILLITFSFILVAITIDGMYVLTLIALGLIATALNQPSIADLSHYGDPFSAANMFNGGIAGGVMAVPTYVSIVGGHIFNSILSDVPFVGGINQLLDPLKGITSIPCGLPLVSGLMPHGACGDSVGLIGLIAQPILFLIILLILVIALFRLWFSLIQAWLSILFNLVLGPFMILFGLLPGMPGGFGGWFKTIISNLLKFPSVLAFLALGHAFAKLMSTGDVFTPPLTTSLGGIDPATFSYIPFNPLNLTTNPGDNPLNPLPKDTISSTGAILMLATYLMAPGIPGEIDKMFKSEQGLAKGIGQGFAPGLGAISTTFRQGAHQIFRDPDELRHQSGGLIYKAIDPTATGVRGSLGKWYLKFKGVNLPDSQLKNWLQGSRVDTTQLKQGGH